MPFDLGPVLHYVGRGRYTTAAAFHYVAERQVIHVPAGFETDLASVPRLFWALIPPHGAYEAAAVLHDYLCVDLYRARAEGRAPEVPSRDADGLFRRVMREAGVGFVVRWVMWVGVRWGALASPARRPGWLRDAPLVVTITAVLTAVAVALLGVVHTGIDAILDWAGGP